VTGELVRLGAQVLIVPTMDVTDWGRGEHELHARIAPVRAAEYGIPVFRAASSGISQSVYGVGYVTASASFPDQLATIQSVLTFGKSGSLPIARVIAPISIIVTMATIECFIFTLLRQKRQARNPARSAAEEISAQSRRNEI
jgi:apolipoprotein N-acyltransferase